MTADHSYSIVSADGTTNVWGGVPTEDDRKRIVFGDKVLAYRDEGDGTETLRLQGTTTAEDLGDTVFATNVIVDFSDHPNGLYVSGGHVYVLGYTDMWVVDSDGSGTLVPIDAGSTSWLAPTGYVHNDAHSPLRVFQESTYPTAPGLFSPADSTVWTDPVDGSRQAVAAWHGYAQMEYSDQLSYEELEPRPDEVHTPTLVGQPYDGGGGDVIYFNYTFDGDDAPPYDYWSTATFSYSWKPGWPNAGIPGGGTCEVRLYALYSGSASPIAGDGMSDSLAGAEDLAHNGYYADLGNPYFALYLHFYVTPDSGPGYDGNLSDGILSATIDGSWTQTFDPPWRELYTRSDYEWFPANDMKVITPDMSDWGPPEQGGATVDPLLSWYGPVGSSRYWTAVAGRVMYERQPYFGPPDGDGDYFLSKFAIAIRWDDPVFGMSGRLGPRRVRFVRSNPS